MAGQFINAPNQSNKKTPEFLLVIWDSDWRMKFCWTGNCTLLVQKNICSLLFQDFNQEKKGNQTGENGDLLEKY